MVTPLSLPLVCDGAMRLDDDGELAITYICIMDCMHLLETQALVKAENLESTTLRLHNTDRVTGVVETGGRQDKKINHSLDGLETGRLGLRIRLHADCLASIISRSLAALETSLQCTAPLPNSQLPTSMDVAM
jgi:hypothetical protein